MWQRINRSPCVSAYGMYVRPWPQIDVKRVSSGLDFNQLLGLGDFPASAI